MLPKNLKLFIITISMLFIIFVSYAKISTWYPGFTREVKSLKHSELEVLNLKERDEISKLVNYEYLESRSLFSDAIGYIQNFEYEKDGIIYSMSISSNCGKYKFVTKPDEIYKNVEIHSSYYNGEQGLVYSYEIIADIDTYPYVVYCDVNKNVFEDKDIAIKNTKKIAYQFMYDLIEQKFE